MIHVQLLQFIEVVFCVLSGLYLFLTSSMAAYRLMRYEFLLSRLNAALLFVDRIALLPALQYHIVAHMNLNSHFLVKSCLGK